MRFGEQGRCGIILVGVELPYETRGRVTGFPYLWRRAGAPRWVDARDVPCLADDLGGFEHITGTGVKEIKRAVDREKRRIKKRQEEAATASAKNESENSQELTEVENA